MTEHALIMCREPGRHSTLDKGHEEGGSAYANVGSSLRSPAGYSRASPPEKNRSLPTVLLCALTSDFTGVCPPPSSRSLCQRVNLQLQFLDYYWSGLTSSKKPIDFLPLVFILDLFFFFLTELLGAESP